MRKGTRGLIVVVALVALFFASSVRAADTPLRLHHTQVMGTHNSYHLKPDALVVRWLPAWDYSHEPIRDQLSFRGVRQLELDIHYDTSAGEFLVHHVTNFDDRSTCPRLVQCLFEIRQWSGLHPGHVPIFVFLEPKTGSLETDWPGAILPRHEELEQTILSVFQPSQILTPDDVRGDSPTLKQAILDRGWPRLDAVRGQVLFVLWSSGANRRVYSDTQTTLRNRLMFVPTDDTGPPVSAIVKRDDTRGSSFRETRRFVRNNYIVPTRSDAPVSLLDPSNLDPELAGDLLDLCVEEFGFDPDELSDDLLAFIDGGELSQEKLQRLDACAELVWEFVDSESTIADSYALRHDTALRSGAHLPRTDHPGLNYSTDGSLIQSFGTYSATIPQGNPARCNPVSAPPNCSAQQIEDVSVEGDEGGGDGGCLVERAGFPSSVNTSMRIVRDVLLVTRPGRLFTRWYYFFSEYALV